MNKERKEIIENISGNYVLTCIETPLLFNAFDKTDAGKIENIQHYCAKIMEKLGLNLTDECISSTLYRFTKMYVKELFYGLNPKNKHRLSVFPNKYGYKKCR